MPINTGFIIQSNISEDLEERKNRLQDPPGPQPGCCGTLRLRSLPEPSGFHWGCTNAAASVHEQGKETHICPEHHRAAPAGTLPHDRSQEGQRSLPDMLWQSGHSGSYFIHVNLHSNAPISHTKVPFETSMQTHSKFCIAAIYVLGDLLSGEWCWFMPSSAQH